MIGERQVLLTATRKRHTPQHGNTNARIVHTSLYWQSSKAIACWQMLANHENKFFLNALIIQHNTSEEKGGVNFHQPGRQWYARQVQATASFAWALYTCSVQTAHHAETLQPQGEMECVSLPVDSHAVQQCHQHVVISQSTDHQGVIQPQDLPTDPWWNWRYHLWRNWISEIFLPNAWRLSERRR